MAASKMLVVAFYTHADQGPGRKRRRRDKHSSIQTSLAIPETEGLSSSAAKNRNVSSFLICVGDPIGMRFNLKISTQLPFIMVLYIRERIPSLLGVRILEGRHTQKILSLLP